MPVSPDRLRATRWCAIHDLDDDAAHSLEIMLHVVRTEEREACANVVRAHALSHDGGPDPGVVGALELAEQEIRGRTP